MWLKAQYPRLLFDVQLNGEHFSIYVFEVL